MEFEDGRFDRAIHSARSARRLHPENTASLLVLGLALEKTGKLEEASETLRSYLQDHRVSPLPEVEATTALGRVLRARSAADSSKKTRNKKGPKKRKKGGESTAERSQLCVQLDPPSAPARLLLDPGTGLANQKPSQDGEELPCFADLPPDAQLSLLVQGPSLERQWLPLQSPAAGESDTVSIATPIIQTGSVELVAFDPEVLRVEFFSHGRKLRGFPGEALEVSVGPLGVRLHSDMGLVEFTTEVSGEAPLVFDPTIYRPASIRVTGLPSHTRVGIEVEGPADRRWSRSLALSSQGAIRDGASGLDLSPPMELDGLAPGRAIVSVWHKEAGTSQFDLALVGGQLTEYQFDLESLAAHPSDGASQ